MNIVKLNQLVGAAAPIHGLSSTGRIDFKDEATPEQRTAAQAVMDANLPNLDNGPVVPSAVTMRQARLALLQTGKLAAVSVAVAASDEATQITWEFSSEMHRDHPFVATLAAALNLTEQDLDNLFMLAGSL